MSWFFLYAPGIPLAIVKQHSICLMFTKLVHITTRRRFCSLCGTDYFKQARKYPEETFEPQNILYLFKTSFPAVISIRKTFSPCRNMEKFYILCPTAVVSSAVSLYSWVLCFFNPKSCSFSWTKKNGTYGNCGMKGRHAKARECLSAELALEFGGSNAEKLQGPSIPIWKGRGSILADQGAWKL